MCSLADQGRVLADAMLSSHGISAIREGQLSAFQSAYVLRQYQHYVENFPKLLAIALTKLSTDAERIPIVENLWDEHGAGTFEHNHRALYAETLSGVMSTTPNVAPVLRMPYGAAVSEFVTLCEELVSAHDASFALGFLGLGTEGVTASLYTAVKRLLDPLGGQTIDRFFELHCSADEHHAALFAKALNAVLEEHGMGGEVLVARGLQAAMELERNFWDAVVHEAEQTYPV